MTQVRIEERNGGAWAVPLGTAWISAYDWPLPDDLRRWIFGGYPENRTWVALAPDESIVGAYLLREVLVWWRGAYRRAAICHDVFVVPEYRRRGIFAELGRRALADAASDGIELCYAFPNATALPGHMRVGWQDAGNVGSIPR